MCLFNPLSGKVLSAEDVFAALARAEMKAVEDYSLMEAPDPQLVLSCALNAVRKCFLQEIEVLLKKT